MRSDNAQRSLQTLSYGAKPSFLPLYRLLKRCYPVSDAGLSSLLRNDRWLISQWKSGRRKPCRSAIQCCRLLILIRVGVARNALFLVDFTHDMLEPLVRQMEEREALEYARERGELP